VSKCQLFVGGKWVDAESGKTFPVLNPATEEEIGRAALGGPADVDRAVQAAMSAFPAWSRLTQSERAKMLHPLGAAIRDAADELIDLEVREHGTPVQMARGFVAGAADQVEFFVSISRALMGQVLDAFSDATVYLKRVPVGVCAVITPWNVPLLMMSAMVTPALVTGNTVILKPASVNSLLAVKFTELLEQLALPPGVMNLMTGPGGSAGEALAGHRGVDMIRFTGSSETGEEIMSVASRTAKETSYRNQATQPTIPTPEMGRRVSASLQMNRLGSWDGTVQEGPDDREKQSTSDEEDAFSIRTATTTRNAAAEASAAASLDPVTGELVSVRKSETLSGLHDTTVETTTPKAWAFEYSYPVKNRGRTGTVHVYVYGNQIMRAAPTLGEGYTANASWSMNRHGLYDGRVTHSPTFWSEVSSTVSEEWSEVRSWIDKTNKTTAVSTPPYDGYYWRKVVESSSWMIGTDQSSAASFAAAGKEGSYSKRLRAGLYIAKKVTAVDYGSWSAGKQSAS